MRLHSKGKSMFKKFLAVPAFFLAVFIPFQVSTKELPEISVWENRSVKYEEYLSCTALKRYSKDKIVAYSKLRFYFKPQNNLDGIILSDDEEWKFFVYSGNAHGGAELTFDMNNGKQKKFRVLFLPFGANNKPPFVTSVITIPLSKGEIKEVMKESKQLRVVLSTTPDVETVFDVSGFKDVIKKTEDCALNSQKVDL